MAKKHAEKAPAKRKSPKKGLIGLAAAAAVVLALCLWYTRSMTISSLSPWMDWDKCTQITAIYYLESGSENPAETTRVITPDDPDFNLLIDAVSTRKFERSLSSLFPQGTMTHNSRIGDFRWQLEFRFDTIEANGSGHKGTLFRCRDFFGKLRMQDMVNDASWNVITADQSAWRTKVMNILLTTVVPLD